MEQFNFITTRDLVYWIELERFIGDIPIYKIESGWYLGSYKFGTDIKHIVTKSITSCVVRHVDQSKLFNSELEAAKAMDVLNTQLRYC